MACLSWSGSEPQTGASPIDQSMTQEETCRKEFVRLMFFERQTADAPLGAAHSPNAFPGWLPVAS